LKLEAYFFFFFIWPGAEAPGPDGTNSNSIMRPSLRRHWKLGLRLPNILSKTARPLPTGRSACGSGCPFLGPECIPQPCPGCTDASRHLVGTRVLKNETYSHIIPEPPSCQAFFSFFFNLRLSGRGAWSLELAACCLWLFIFFILQL